MIAPISSTGAPAGARVARVLVLMATFNGAKWIREQLRSIVDQRGVELALTVSDDASSDGTLALVQATLGDMKGLRVVRSSHSGGSAAANFFRAIQTVDATECDFVALADQDDVWEPDKLARAVACLDSGDAVGYSAAVHAFWPDGRTALLTQRRVPTSADYVFEGAGQGCTFVLRARFFGEVQRSLAAHNAHLRSLHYHDWTLYALCRAHGHQWFFDDWACMRYRQHAGNDTGARSGRAGIAKRLTLIRSGWYGKQVDAIARLCVAVAGESAAGAVAYLQQREAARVTWAGRMKLCAFVAQHGRRRWTDRVFLMWAVAAGHLSRGVPPGDAR